MSSSMTSPSQGQLVTFTELLSARKIVNNCNWVRRTPILRDAASGMTDLMKLGLSELTLKLESLQVTGSFKVRGLSVMLALLPKSVTDPNGRGLVTMSAGNFGRSFAFATNRLGIPAVVCMPTTAPENRTHVIEALGARVERTESRLLKDLVDHHVIENGMHFAHPFDDLDLIRGHASLGLELLDELQADAIPDIVVVCCGGGGLLSGVAAAIKLSSNAHGRVPPKVIGVEPEGACTMYMSLKNGKVMSVDHVNTIAAGLAPPFSGSHCYQHVVEFVDDVVLVTDEEIVSAMRTLLELGLKVEPSGCAAMAALISGKLGNVCNKKVSCIITGSNISPSEFPDFSLC